MDEMYDVGQGVPSFWIWCVWQTNTWKQGNAAQLSSSSPKRGSATMIFRDAGT